MIWIWIADTKGLFQKRDRREWLIDHKKLAFTRQMREREVRWTWSSSSNRLDQTNAYSSLMTKWERVAEVPSSQTTHLGLNKFGQISVSSWSSWFLFKWQLEIIYSIVQNCVHNLSTTTNLYLQWTASMVPRYTLLYQIAHLEVHEATLRSATKRCFHRFNLCTMTCNRSLTLFFPSCQRRRFAPLVKTYQ